MKNEARGDNHKQVIEEDQRLKETSSTQIRKAREQWVEENEAKKKEMIEQGLDPVREELLHTTAAENERKKKSKHEKGEENFGWERKKLFSLFIV
jgi:hypothetical protein